MDIRLLQEQGIHFAKGANLLPKGINKKLRVVNDGFACDAQPQLVTVSNSGIPAYLANWVDPSIIEVLLAPLMAAQIMGGEEAQKGNWTTKTAQFPIIERTGQVSAYGDYSESGQANANANFVSRDSYHYQVFTEWGELELENMGLARINWAAEQSQASVEALNIFQNESYFYGIDGLKNYGLLNDPNLSAPITPTPKTAGGYSWADATGIEVVADFNKLFKQLVSQTKGLVNTKTPMTFVFSPEAETDSLIKPSVYMNVSVRDYLKSIYPNVTFETAPQYNTESGRLVQLIVTSYQGKKTGQPGFTEKLRAHPVTIGSSSWKQKKSQGTWGALIYQPIFYAQMLGV